MRTALDRERSGYERFVPTQTTRGSARRVAMRRAPRCDWKLSLALWVPVDEPSLGITEHSIVLSIGTDDSLAHEVRSFVTRSRQNGARIGYLEVAGGATVRKDGIEPVPGRGESLAR